MFNAPLFLQHCCQPGITFHVNLLPLDKCCGYGFSELRQTGFLIIFPCWWKMFFWSIFYLQVCPPSRVLASQVSPEKRPQFLLPPGTGLLSQPVCLLNPKSLRGAATQDYRNVSPYCSDFLSPSMGISYFLGCACKEKFSSLEVYRNPLGSF